MTRIGRQSSFGTIFLVAMLGIACEDDHVDTSMSASGTTEGTSVATSTTSTDQATGTTGADSSTAPTSTIGTSTSDDVSTSTSDTTAESTDGSTESTGASGPCSRIHEGDLVVKDDTDLAALGDIGRVTGTVYISMYDREQPDLSFLSCLHTIDDGLSLQNNGPLETTKGLVNLKNVLRINIFQNKGLRTIDRFDSIVDLFTLVIVGNSSLEEIHLDSIETVGGLKIGYCQGNMGSTLQGKLTTLSGFSGLTSVQSLTIEGHPALMTAEILDALALSPAPKPLSFATVRYNLLLPETDVDATLDDLGLDMQHREVCGNAGGDPECYCVVG